MNSHTITIPGEKPDLDAFEMDFEAYEQAEKPVTEDSRLYWFNGLPTNTDLNAIGWHLKYKINPKLDETLEGILRDDNTALRDAMGLQLYEVQHKRAGKDGKNDPVMYWRLKSCSLVIVAHRKQSTLEMKRRTDRLGIAWNWETVRDEAGIIKVNKVGKEARQTLLKMRVFIHELYQLGVTDWFPVTISGFGTDELLKAFDDHYRVLEAYSEGRRAQGKNPIAPFYLFSLPTTSGPVKLVGEPPDQGSIYPIVSQVPTTINKGYLAEHFVGPDLAKFIREELLDLTTMWSYEESLKIAEGTSSDGQLLLSENASVLAVDPAQSAPSAGTPSTDAFVDAEQLQWIRTQYCAGNEETLRQICTFFQADPAAPTQLRVSHYQKLLEMAQQASGPSQKRAKK